MSGTGENQVGFWCIEMSKASKIDTWGAGTEIYNFALFMYLRIFPSITK